MSYSQESWELRTRQKGPGMTRSQEAQVWSPCFLSWSLGTALFLQKHKIRVAEESPGNKKSGEGVCLKWKFPPKILMVLT